MTAKKATAALQLKELYHCDKLISFGDQTNDLDLFAASDECYAVANANQALKKIATGVIENNNADGVARWLKENAAF